MIFENRLAKIGKCFNVNLYIKNSDEILIFFFNDFCGEKCLKISKEKFELNLESTTFSCDEIIKLNEIMYVYRKNNNIGLLK